MNPCPEHGEPTTTRPRRSSTNEPVDGRGVEARLCTDRLWIQVGEPLADPRLDANDRFRVRRACVVRVDLRAAVVHTGLEAVDGVGERIHPVPAGDLVELDDRGPSRAVAAEVRERLARHLHRHVGHEVAHPGAGRHDDDVCVEVVHGLDLLPHLDARAAHDREIEERALREVGAHGAGLRLQQR